MSPAPEGGPAPVAVSDEALHKAAYDVHTYGHTAMGYPQDIEAMPTMYKYSLSFFERYYRPENVVILVVGDFEVEPTRALLQKYYADWQRGYKPPQVPAEPEQRKEKRIEVPYQGQSLPILWAAYKIDAFDPAVVTVTKIVATRQADPGLRQTLGRVDRDLPTIG